MPPNNYLLHKTNITIVNPLTTKLDRYELSQVLRQQPNARFFRLPWKLWLYNSLDSAAVANKKFKRLQSFEKKLSVKSEKVKQINARRNKKALSKGRPDYRYKALPDSTFKQVIWAEKLKYKFGQKPVVFDTLLHLKSQEQLSRYLVKKGYYYAKVSATVKLNEKKRYAQTTYLIDEGPQYIIDSVTYVGPRLLRDLHLKLIRKNYEPLGEHPLLGKPFDLDYLESYREKVAKFMRDESIYKFNGTSIEFLAETNRQDMSVHLTMSFEDRLVTALQNPDSLIRVPYRSTKINKVYFHLADSAFMQTSFIAEAQS